MKKKITVLLGYHYKYMKEVEEDVRYKVLEVTNSLFPRVTADLTKQEVQILIDAGMEVTIKKYA